MGRRPGSGSMTAKRRCHIRRIPAIAAFGLIWLAGAQADGPKECRQERATTVCQAAGQALRVIHESRSPSGRYAVAWIASASGVALEANPADGTLGAAAGEARNVLLRLQGTAVLARDVGTHPGDLAAYNHRRSDVRWSADSALVGILNHDKWETLSGKVFRLGKDGLATAPFDLLAFAREVGQRRLAGLRAPVDPVDYATRVILRSVGNDGIIRARIVMEQPGGGGTAYAFSMNLRLLEVSAALRAKTIKLGRLARIE